MTCEINKTLVCKPLSNEQRVVYLAGPGVFARHPLAHGRALKAVCHRFGLVGLYPMDNKIPASQDVAGDIYRANMELLLRCHVVVADMTPFRGVSMDPGTAYEMGVAAGMGKPVIGYTLDSRSYLQRVQSNHDLTKSADGSWWDNNDFQVESFSIPLADNLMMAKCVRAMFSSAEHAIAFAASCDR